MFSLVADYDTASSTSSSDLDTEDDSEKQEKVENFNNTAPAKPIPLLPSANFLLKSGAPRSAGEVFNNSFLVAEKTELDKLQKHVKMVESEDHLLQKNGRKICWNNRKGRCRFGNKCKYAHDSDLVGEPSSVGVKNQQQIPAEDSNKNKSNTLISHIHQTDPSTVCNNKLKNRKRPGLGDSIVPGKRVMKSYQDTKKSS